MHDKSVCEPGVYDRAVKALKTAKAKGFRVTINCTFFNDADPARVAAFFDTVTELGVDGITVSPGYAYERAPDQKHFLNRSATKQLFRSIFERGNKGRKWAFNQSTMFLDFLAGNQTYHCTPWGNPTRTVFGWQKPCYLLGEGYTKTFKELMDDTDWDAYGTGNYEKCADCMVHSGFEATAVARYGDEALEGGARRAHGRQDRRARWPRTFRSMASARPSTCSTRTSPRSCQTSAAPRPRKRPGRRLPQRFNARNAARLSRAAARSAASWPGERMSSPMTATASIPPSESTAFNTSGGRLRSAGSETPRRMANGICLLPRIAARDQAFHVYGGRASGPAQVRLVGYGQDRSVRGRHTFDKTLARRLQRVAAQETSDRLVSLDGALVRDDLRAENEVAGTEPRIKPAAEAPADHERRARARHFREPRSQARRVAAERRASRARHDRRLALQPADDQDVGGRRQGRAAPGRPASRASRLAVRSRRVLTRASAPPPPARIEANSSRRVARSLIVPLR